MCIGYFTHPKCGFYLSQVRILPASSKAFFARMMLSRGGCAIYHVMNRGDRREPIFLHDADQQRFVETLGEAGVKTGWQVHA